MPRRQLSALDVANVIFAAASFLQIFAAPRTWGAAGALAAAAPRDVVDPAVATILRHYANFEQHCAILQLALGAIVLFVARRGDTALRKEAASIYAIQYFFAMCLVVVRQRDESTPTVIAANAVALGALAACNLAAYFS